VERIPLQRGMGRPDSSDEGRVDKGGSIGEETVDGSVGGCR